MNSSVALIIVLGSLLMMGVSGLIERRKLERRIEVLEAKATLSQSSLAGRE